MGLSRGPGLLAALTPLSAELLGQTDEPRLVNALDDLDRGGFRKPVGVELARPIDRYGGRVYRLISLLLLLAGCGGPGDYGVSRPRSPQGSAQPGLDWRTTITGDVVLDAWSILVVW